VVSLSILGKYGVCYRFDLQLMTTVSFWLIGIRP